MEQFANIIQQPNSPLIIYELIPPTLNHTKQAIQAYAECAIDLVSSSKIAINAINLPEIHNEVKKNERTYDYQQKMDPVEFARLLISLLKRNNMAEIDIIVNHVTVHTTWVEQKQWLKKAKESNLQTLVLVGGESHKIKYPGPSVNDLGKYCKQHLPDIICGGITIARRRHKPPKLDEPERVILKADAGLKFFTSQIIYSSTKINKFLLDYDRKCKKLKKQPQRIVLSFSPISRKKDMVFLEWLGVDIPKEVKSVLNKTDIGIGWRSIKISKLILEDIMIFMLKNKINIPLGINIEHVNIHNFELSKEFIDQLGKIYLDYMNVIRKVNWK